ncbi:hypothetical protein FACS18949_17410 [Clostridia bacterium]|nr:hypothetical protein FACS18949_17410 [Clostridia bacterium]
MKKRYFLIAWAALLAFGLWYSAHTKGELFTVDYTPEGLSAAVLLFDVDTEMNGDGITFEELRGKADLIARATLGDSRDGKFGCVLSEVNILEVYKGSAGSHVYVYEPASVSEAGYYLPDNSLVRNTAYRTPNGYNLMSPGREYILFLQAFEGNMYLFADALYGKICAEVNPNMAVIDPARSPTQGYAANRELKYAGYMDWDILPYSGAVLERYLSLANSVNVWYTNSRS